MDEVTEAREVLRKLSGKKFEERPTPEQRKAIGEYFTALYGEQFKEIQEEIEKLEKKIRDLEILTENTAISTEIALNALAIMKEIYRWMPQGRFDAIVEYGYVKEKINILTRSYEGLRHNIKSGYLY